MRYLQMVHKLFLFSIHLAAGQMSHCEELLQEERQTLFDSHVRQKLAHFIQKEHGKSRLGRRVCENFMMEIAKHHVMSEEIKIT